MNARTLILLLGALAISPAGAELSNEPGVCQNCNGGGTTDSGKTWSSPSQDSAPWQPAESHEALKARLLQEGRHQWDRRAPDRRAEWQAERAPTQRLVAEGDRLRSMGVEVTAPIKNTRIFNTTSGVRGALKGKPRDTDPRILNTAWAQLDCASKLAASVFETFEKSPEEALYLADEAQNALNGATKGIACTPAAPPVGYGESQVASRTELQSRLKQVTAAIESYQAATQTRATLELVAEQHQTAAAAAANAAADAKAKAQQARRKGARQEEMEIKEIARRQAEFQKREEERYKKIFEEQKKNEEALAAALAALKAGNEFRTKRPQP